MYGKKKIAQSRTQPLPVRIFQRWKHECILRALGLDVEEQEPESEPEQQQGKKDEEDGWLRGGNGNGNRNGNNGQNGYGYGGLKENQRPEWRDENNNNNNNNINNNNSNNNSNLNVETSRFIQPVIDSSRRLGLGLGGVMRSIAAGGAGIPGISLPGRMPARGVMGIP